MISFPMTTEIHADFEDECEAGTTWETRVIDAASDYETPDAECMAGVGVGG
ncbi:hypothetical protein LVB87_11220 [Lysobacter sp. KIS68-7]|uniref:hypothetical protein n=1 Tax=Lysobacter sp. KIS68-7 TaxID=2904252 RepID=UPI001E50A749|nr:hypothetical protein [Lysobacter sp. KIS68-7]UHQ18754.1 hypothetical protein LVB87_11220 [Lysobacter sp. KIS68-7]